jgi:succinyl-diaminopimelate desuccinylase
VTDLLALAARLVDVPSVSFEEGPLADLVEAELRSLGHLAVDRVGDNVVARTQLDRPLRLILAGHTDTVPPNDNLGARVEGDVLFGLGACDMKGSLAAMLDVARAVPEPAVDVTFVFYAREEVASEHSGLGEIERSRPDLLVGDVALLGEPTSAAVEAGCQGTLRARVTMRGARAHTARPWMGRNAIHRLAPVLARLEAYEPRRPVIDGCEYREAVQAVWVEGGVAGNVVPDEAVVTVNHRFAPDRSAAQAEAALAEIVGPVDCFEVTDAVPGAVPSLSHPLLVTLIERNRLGVSAKLGWTDVAFFAARGTPAANFGAGDAELAHTKDEWVSRADVEAVRGALVDLLVGGIDAGGVDPAS